MIDGNVTVMRYDAIGNLWVASDNCVNVLLADLTFWRLDGFTQGLPYANVTALAHDYHQVIQAYIYVPVCAFEL